MNSRVICNYKNEVIARISSFEKVNKGVEFYSSTEDYLQVAVSRYDICDSVKNHTHTSIKRDIQGTHEVLIILKGSGLIRIFSQDRSLEGEIEFKANEIVSLFGGSHGIEFFEETSLIEVKQGPFFSATLDKIKW